jgi:hypothetical protein
MGGPYSGSSLARFVRVGAVATGITYGFVVSGVWSLVRRLFFRALLLLRLFLFLLFCALRVRRGISLVSLEFYTFLSFLSLVSETDSGKCVHSSLVLSFLRTGETIAEIGKEALKTIDWSTQTPTR